MTDERRKQLLEVMMQLGGLSEEAQVAAAAFMQGWEAAMNAMKKDTAQTKP